MAFLVDYGLILGLIRGLAMPITTLILGHGPPAPFGATQIDRALSPAITGAISLLTWMLYFALQESSGPQTTLGKRLFRLRVVGTDGERLSFGRAAYRAFVKLISLHIAVVTRRRQFLHDLAARTVVIREARRQTTRGDTG